MRTTGGFGIKNDGQPDHPSCDCISQLMFKGKSLLRGVDRVCLESRNHHSILFCKYRCY